MEALFKFWMVASVASVGSNFHKGQTSATRAQSRESVGLQMAVQQVQVSKPKGQQVKTMKAWSYVWRASRKSVKSRTWKGGV